METQKLRITLRRSGIGYPERQKATLRALGLRRLNAAVVHDATPAVRGMVNKVTHLVEVEEV